MADTKVIVNCATGESTIVELTAQEIAERDQMAAEAEERRAAEEAAAEALAALKASAKAKLVAGTPLTTEEAAVLVI
jgi:formylmethanofuran dehydrogenase subunit B